MKKFFKVLPSPNKPAKPSNESIKPSNSSSEKIQQFKEPKPKKKKQKTELNDDIFDADVSMDDSKDVVDIEDSDENDEVIEESVKSDARGKLVWAKLEGFPWWPGLICDDPQYNGYTRTNRVGTDKTHVQFFDIPPSRAWVPSKYCKDYRGSSVDDKYIEDDPEQKVAYTDADSYIAMSNDERLDKLLIKDEDDKENKNVKPCKNDSNERKRSNEEVDEIDKVEPPKKKSRKKNVIQSDSEDDYKPEEDEEDEEDEEADDDEVEESPEKPLKSSPKTPKPKSRVTKTPTTPKTPITPSNSASRAAASLAKFSRTPSSTPAKPASEPTQYLHHTLSWLKPDRIRDRERKTIEDESYDPKTLFIPPDFLNKCTPGMKQWWEIKSKYFDLILFFKVGKFYELYHMDAEISVRELGLIYMKGNFAHCGFPEKSFGRYSETLVQKGYRVARIEQTSRPGENKSKTVNREVCAVITKGTKTHSFMEGQSPEVQNCYLMGVCEKENVFGVCLVDTSVGTFTLSQFSDDRNSSRLRTLISHYNVVQVLYPRRDISASLQNILKTELAGALQDPRARDKEFWSGSRTLKELAAGRYFVEEGAEEASWPGVISQITDGEEGCFNAAPLEEYELALSSLGALVQYLRACLIERPLLALKQFQLFTPEQFHVRTSGQEFPKDDQKLVLDNISIDNLEILQTTDGKSEGSLLNILDKCVTAAGKRLLRQWVCRPLCHPAQITKRLDALDNLLAHPGKVQQVQPVLRKVPDLERLLRKVHAQGLKLPPDHPDTRAVMFEMEVYSKKKIVDLVNSLDGFKKLMELMTLFEDVEMTSELLSSVVVIDDVKGFPDLTEKLKFYEDCFEREEALKKGIILPKPGVNDAYDAAVNDINTIEENFKDLLTKYKKELQIPLNFFGAAKNRFMVEVSDSHNRKIPSSWEVQSQRKGYVRYYFPEAKGLKLELEKAEIRKDVALRDTMRILFHKFSQHYDLWSRAVKCSATLDVLLSLSLYSSSTETCRPDLIASCDPFLRIENGSHPILLPSFNPGEFIPNDTVLGDNQKLCLVVTGPNMGGKSTLMRQVGLLVVLAQMGCRVPATSMSLTPVDRIFTRLGASDNIMKGESTFFVELSETSTILTHASKHSLVLLDELGRGTATYDGTAIAGSVIENITREIKARTLFSTHYHRLVDELGEAGEVSLGHMSCMNNDEEDQQDITFLYKLASGACPKSFGFNAARLAGIPESVIAEALEIATQFEKLSDRFHLFGKLMNPKSDIDKLCSKLEAILN